MQDLLTQTHSESQLLTGQRMVEVPIFRPQRKSQSLRGLKRLVANLVLSQTRTDAPLGKVRSIAR